VLGIAEVLETEIGTIEAEARLKRRENQLLADVAGARLHRGAKAIEEEARGDHEQAIARHLRHGQARAQAAHRLRRPYGFALQHRRRLIVSNLKERYETTRDRDSGTRSRRRDDARETRSEHKLFGVLFEKERRNDVRRPHGEQHAERAAGHRDEGAVREQLSRELAAAGAKGDANRRVARTGGGPRQQERGDVGTRDD
jgi:hypothetical protein